MGSNPMSRLKVTWFRQWHAELDAALACLPEPEACPHDLTRTLMQTPGPAEKRTALVTEDGRPLAVIGLRRRTRLTWEPAAQWLIPGVPFPVRPGATIAALRALNIAIPVAWWRMTEPVPEAPCIRRFETQPVYRLALAGDREAFWRQTHYLRHIKNIRNRCAAFTWALDPPGAARWVITHWSQRWRDGADADPAVEDRILIAEALEARGLHHTVCLYDGEKLIAGSTNFVHRGDLVAGVIHGDPDYRNHGIGVRLIDQTFAFAAGEGLAGFDLGAGHDYKKKWAPEDGSRGTFVLAPEPIWRMQRAISTLRRLMPGRKPYPEPVEG